MRTGRAICAKTKTKTRRRRPLSRQTGKTGNKVEHASLANPKDFRVLDTGDSSSYLRRHRPRSCNFRLKLPACVGVAYTQAPYLMGKKQLHSIATHSYHAKQKATYNAPIESSIHSRSLSSSARVRSYSSLAVNCLTTARFFRRFFDRGDTTVNG